MNIKKSIIESIKEVSPSRIRFCWEINGKSWKSDWVIGQPEDLQATIDRCNLKYGSDTHWVEVEE
jgi:hypothetical protein